MRLAGLCLVAGALASALKGQVPLNPVVTPRGIVNAFTRQPAPSVVAPGGLLTITGLNLGPADELKADAPWPLKLGEVEVLVNNRPAAIGFVRPGRIMALVPMEVTAGLAQVVVRRGEATSRPARFLVQAIAPSVKSADGSGAGEAALTGTTVAVSGLGARGADADVKAYVGGLAASSSIAETLRPGEFDVALTAPDAAANGDLITIMVNNRVSNRLTWRKLASPEVQYMPLPDGTPELRSIQTTDLRSSFLTANAARSDSGCYRTWLFDMAAQKSSLLDDCLTTGVRQALTPMVMAPETATFAALAGPPLGETPNPVSSKVRIVSAGGGDPVQVDLPSPAINLAAIAGGNYIANMGSAGLLEIDATTGATHEFTGAGGFGGGGGNGNPGLNPASLNIEVDGLKVLLSPPVAIQGNLFLVVVGDDEDKPTRAKLAAINAQGQVQDSKDFPDGWLPLIPPAQQLPAGGGQFPGGLPGGVANLVRIRLTTMLDAQTRTLLILGHKADDSKHAILAYSIADQSFRALEFPDGWFAATCSPRVPFLNLELSRRIALFGDHSSAGAIKTPCPAQGFVTMDLANGRIDAIPTPAQGLMNAGGQADEMNDFIFATDIDASRNNRAETVFLLDGVTLTPFRFDPSPIVQAITNVTRVPDMNLLIATAAPNAGFVVFDLERVETRLLPTPDGFTNVQFLSVFPATRKLIARGIKSDGAQLLIYDLVSGDLAIVANPAGVAWFGPPVATPAGGPGGGGPGQGGQGQQQAVNGLRANEKANAVAAITYGADRRQTGVAVVRVP